MELLKLCLFLIFEPGTHLDSFPAFLTDAFGRALQLFASELVEQRHIADVHTVLVVAEQGALMLPPCFS